MGSGVKDLNGFKMVPELRFGEFSGEWEEKRLGEYINQISGYSFKGEEISEEKGGTFILRGINISEGFIRNSKKIDRYFHGNSSSLDKYILEENDLVIGMDGSKVGKNAALVSKKQKGSLLIQRVARLRATSDSSILYIYQLIRSKRFIRYVDVVNTSSGIPHISSKQINDYLIPFTSLAEQEKIAGFLVAVDNKIEGLKKKKDLLGVYKKGMMQKLFPKDGCEPEFRFKDVDGGTFGDWVVKPLGKYIDQISGFAFKGNDISEEKSSNFILRGINISEGFIRHSEKIDRYFQGSISGFEKYILNENDLVIGMDGSKVGKNSALVTEKENGSILIQRVARIRAKPTANIFYLYQLIRSKSFIRYVDTVNTSSGIPHISAKQINDFMIPIPSLLEQNKVADFLSGIDSKIVGVEKLIESAEEFKKGLLQKLFV